MLKRLVTGQLSLPMTFWGWGFCGNFFIGLIGLAGIHTGHLIWVPLSFIGKTVLCSAVLSGLTFILRRKISVFGVLAFFIALIQGIMSIVLFVKLSSILFR